MDKEKFFESWKKKWEKEKEQIEPGQAQLFRKIRDRKNLEKLEILK